MPGTMSKLLAVAAIASLALSNCACAQNKKKEEIRKLMKEHKERKDMAPVVGTDAPNFKLKTMDGEKTVELASFKGKKPVVLVFGSYT